MKKIVLIFNHFEREHFGKDVFLFPYTLSKCVGGKAMIVYPETSSNKNFPSEYRNVTLKSLPFKGKESSWFLYREWNFLIFLIRKSKEIDILLRIHFTFMTALFVLLYKMINPKGITAVKLDGYLDPLFFSSDSLSLFKRLKHKVFFRTLRQVDLLTVETQCLYDRLYKEFIDVYDIKLKLVLMPNGFDEETLKTLSIVEKDFGHKENIMITVGRLGTYQKNTEMLLNALDLMELRDWKVYLIGSISEDLDFFLKDFFMRNPSKKESVFFVGPIYDKKSLWEFYNRAKVFILTSRFEGYPLVLTEAKRFRNYIVSTELCLRIHRSGWDIYSVPSAQITHLEGRASYIKQSRLYFLYEGQYIYFRKVYGKFGCRLIFAITQLKSYVRIFQFLLLGNRKRGAYWKMKLETNREVWNSERIKRILK